MQAWGGAARVIRAISSWPGHRAIYISGIRSAARVQVPARGIYMRFLFSALELNRVRVVTFIVAECTCCFVWIRLPTGTTAKSCCS